MWYIQQLLLYMCSILLNLLYIHLCKFLYIQGVASCCNTLHYVFQTTALWHNPPSVMFSPSVVFSLSLSFCSLPSLSSYFPTSLVYFLYSFLHSPPPPPALSLILSLSPSLPPPLPPSPPSHPPFLPPSLPPSSLPPSPPSHQDRK